MRNLSDAEIQHHLKELGVYGYTRIEGGMSGAETGHYLKLVRDHYEKTSRLAYTGRRADRDADKIVYNLQNKDKAFIDLLGNDSIDKILMTCLNDPFYRFLPPSEPNYVLGYYNARSSGKKLALHTDTYMPSFGERTWTMQVVYVLEDMNRQNGCTTVVPGSHLTGRFVDYGLERIEYVDANAGDVVLWDSRLWHGTSENASGGTRWALVATYSCWWLKQRTDMPRSLPNEIYRQLSDRQKALLGFCSIPPKDETDRLNTKCGYEVLKPSVEDYFS